MSVETAVLNPPPQAEFPTSFATAPSSGTKYPALNAGAALFDPRRMQDLLDGEQRGIRERVKAILTRPEFRYYQGTDKNEHRNVVFNWMLELAHQGLGRLGYPLIAGGEADTRKFLAAFETIAMHDLSLLIKFGVQFGLFGGSIQQLGTAYHHEKFLKACGTGALPGCFAMTEIGHGSNVKDIETTAIYDPLTQTFEIHSPTQSAGKTYIGNAALHGRAATVFAQLLVNGEHHGVHAFVVPLRNSEGFLLPGVRIEDNGLKVGLNGVDNGRIWFDHVRIPREDMLDRFATVSVDGRYASPIANQSARFFTMLGTLVGGRVSIASSGNTAAKSALAIAIRYAARRRQFTGGKNTTETLLLDYPTHQRRLMPRLANVYALHFAIRNLGEVYAQPNRDEKATRALEALAAGIKAWSTWNATATIQTCRECCGGEGYIAANRFAALKADSDIFTTFEGDNTVLMQLLAKNLLLEMSGKFKSMSTLEMVQFFGQQTGTRIAEMNPIVTLKVDKDHLRDTAFHLSALAYREQRILEGAAKRVRKLVKDGLDPYAAYLQCQVRFGELAEASVEHEIAKQFSAAIAKESDPGLRTALRPLLDLFCLGLLEKHSGWFLEYGYLGAKKTKMIRREVEELCSSVREQSVALVDSFGIPDELLAAPIALD